MASTSITIRMDDSLKKQAEDPFYSEENQRVLRKSIADLEAGKGQVHELIEVDDD